MTIMKVLVIFVSSTGTTTTYVFIYVAYGHIIRSYDLTHLFLSRHKKTTIVKQSPLRPIPISDFKQGRDKGRNKNA